MTYVVVFFGFVGGTILFFIIRSNADIDKDEEVPPQD